MTCTYSFTVNRAGHYALFVDDVDDGVGMTVNPDLVVVPPPNPPYYEAAVDTATLSISGIPPNWINDTARLQWTMACLDSVPAPALASTSNTLAIQEIVFEPAVTSANCLLSVTVNGLLLQVEFEWAGAYMDALPVQAIAGDDDALVEGGTWEVRSFYRDNPLNGSVEIRVRLRVSVVVWSGPVRGRGGDWVLV